MNCCSRIDADKELFDLSAENTIVIYLKLLSEPSKIG
jgi:hypothetical protein